MPETEWTGKNQYDGVLFQDDPADGSGMTDTVSGYAVEERYTKGKMRQFFLQKPAISPGTRLITGREDAVAAGNDDMAEDVRAGIFVHVSNTIVPGLSCHPVFNLQRLNPSELLGIICDQDQIPA